MRTSGFDKGVQTYNFSAILEITVAGFEGSATRKMVSRHSDPIFRGSKCPSNMQICRSASKPVTMFAGGFQTQ